MVSITHAPKSSMAQWLMIQSKLGIFIKQLGFLGEVVTRSFIGRLSDQLDLQDCIVTCDVGFVVEGLRPMARCPPQTAIFQLSGCKALPCSAPMGSLELGLWLKLGWWNQKGILRLGSCQSSQPKGVL